MAGENAGKSAKPSRCHSIACQQASQPTSRRSPILQADRLTDKSNSLAKRHSCLAGL